MSSGGSSGTKVATYYVGQHLILCHGPIDAITEIIADEKSAWTGTNTGGTLHIDAPDLFGGMTREGGITGDVDILMGYPTQGANTYLDRLYGETIPYYRGVVSAALRQIYVGLNYYMKPIHWRSSRIHTRKNGIPQWQDTYAAIPSEPVTSYVSNLPSISTMTYSGTTVTVVFAAAHGLNTNDVVTVVGSLDSLYNGVFEVVAVNGTTIEYTVSSVPAANPVGPINISKGTATTFGAGLINAVHGLRDCLTDSTWGYGYSEGLIDETSWAAAAITCYNERLGFSWLWSEGTLEDFMNNVADHIQGNIYQDRKTGQYKINLVRKLTTTTGLLELNAYNSFKISDFHRLSIGNLVSSVTVKYRDAATGKSATSPPAIDIALAQRQAVPVEKVITFDGVKTLEVAQKLALSRLQQLSYPAYSFSIEVNRDAENMQKGDAFILDRPDYYPTPLVMRVVEIDLGTLTNGRININAVQDVFAAADTVYLTPSVSTWTSPLTTPIDTVYRILNEIPYYLVAIFKGDVFAQSVPTTEGYIIQAAASPTNDSIHASLWTDAGAGYIARSILDFCFTAEVSVPIDKVDTTLLITNVIDIELLNADHFIQIGDELLGVVAIVGNALTVIRGVLDTVPQAHNATDRIFGWHDYSATDDIPYLLGEVVNTKLTTVTPTGELALGAASTNTITITGRMHLPYPPGALNIDSLYWPAYVPTATVPILWAHRNRFQQTVGLMDYYTGSVSTEPGVTYSATLKRTDTLATLDSFTGEIGTSYLFAPAYLGEVILEMWSVSANGNSMQTVSHTFFIGSWDILPATWATWTTWN